MTANSCADEKCWVQIASFLKEPEMLQEALLRRSKSTTSEFLHKFYQNQ